MNAVDPSVTTFDRFPSGWSVEPIPYNPEMFPLSLTTIRQSLALRPHLNFE